ncbi:MAG: hypothetical protein R2713_20965 [Ilumatobacteraceae bacterium]
MYDAVAATMQKDLKRLVAHSSVAHSASSCSARSYHLAGDQRRDDADDQPRSQHRGGGSCSSG